MSISAAAAVAVATCVVGTGCALVGILRCSAASQQVWAVVKLRLPVVVSIGWSLLMCIAICLRFAAAPGYCDAVFWISHLTPSMYSAPFILRGLQLLVSMSVRHRTSWFAMTWALPVLFGAALVVDLVLAGISLWELPPSLCVMFEQWPFYCVQLVFYSLASGYVGLQLRLLSVRDVYGIAAQLMACAFCWAVFAGSYFVLLVIELHSDSAYAAFEATFPAEILLLIMQLPIWAVTLFSAQAVLQAKLAPKPVVQPETPDVPEFLRAIPLQAAWAHPQLRDDIVRGAVARLIPELTSFLQDWEAISRSITATPHADTLCPQLRHLRDTYFVRGAALELNLSQADRVKAVTVLDQSCGSLSFADLPQGLEHVLRRVAHMLDVNVYQELAADPSFRAHAVCMLQTVV